MTTETVVRYQPRGTCLELWKAQDTECLIEGPAGTGKTRSALEYMHATAIRWPRSKQLIARKTNTALATAALATYRDKVAAAEIASGAVIAFGGSGSEPPGFRYSNGSTIEYRGLDDPSKTLSTEYDNVYVNEATECTEDDWELLTRCLRNGVTPRQRLIGDCNPSTDRHWLLRRCNTGKTRRLRSTVKDNPLYWDEALGDYTPEGHAYIEEIVGNMTGTRRQRLFEGEWVGLENAIYESLDRDKQLVPVPEGWLWSRSAIGVDYGTVHISAVVVVSLDTTGRYWVRECWTGGEDEQAIENAVNSFKVRYGARAGIVDPIPAMQMLANRLVFKRSGTTTAGARGGEGSRIANVLRVKTLLGNDALRFDINGAGVNDLFGEALDYKWLHKDTENIEKYIVDRHNDDRVAAMEYAIEALLTIPGGQMLMHAQGTTYERTPDTTRRGAVRRSQQESIQTLGGQA